MWDEWSVSGREPGPGSLHEALRTRRRRVGPRTERREEGLGGPRGLYGSVESRTEGVQEITFSG